MGYKYKGKKENGFALVTVLIVFAVVSMLGTTILSVVTSEHKFTNLDSRHQSAYYVAESGINLMLSTINNKIDTDFNDYSTEGQFFQAFESEFLDRKHVFDSFEENFGEIPIAEISVELEDIGDKSRDYRVESSGSIGSNTRKVNSIITISWTASSQNPIVDDLLFYTKDFSFQGSNMNGENGISVSDGIDVHDLNGGAGLKISTMYFNGPVKIDNSSNDLGNKNSPGTIYVNGDLQLISGSGRHVYGDIRVKGKFTLKDIHVHGDVYVDGDVEFQDTGKPQIYKNLYYTGDFKYPAYHETNHPEIIKERCKWVSSVEDWEVPVREISLRDDDWYINNGYEIKGNVSQQVHSNAKWLVDNYNFTGWQGSGNLNNVVIVSREDIKINTVTNFSGALIAPNGFVTLPQGGTTFNGVIISKNGFNVTGGGSTVNLKSLQEVFTIEEMPVIFNIPGDPNNGSGNSNSGDIKMSIKSGIKEH